MATALTSLQHQHQHSQQLQFNVPANPVSSSPVSSASPAPSPANDNFCKECGLAFESQTSLEVHLSYHRSNLLSRWAAQGNSNTMDSKFQPKAEIHPPPISAPSNISPSYYDPHHGPYTLHPDYQQNHNDGPPHFQRHHYSPPEGPPPHGYDHHRQRDPPPQKDRPGPTPEEILDLDSNKVHIYNLPPHQQLQYIQSNSFYRPYLMTQPTQSPGSHPQHQNLQPPPPFPHDNMYRSGSPQTRSPANMIMNNPYDFPHAHGNYPPGGNGPPEHQNPPNLPFHQGQQQGGQGQGQTFRGNFPIKQPFSDESRSPEPMMSSPGLLMPTEGTPMTKGTKKGKGSGPVNGSNEDSNSPAPAKTKGWKGGECKRPKTYNCVACNKWFTSSGHLKRHYGTTLHKNSLRQRGENPDDEPPTPSTGKKTKGPQQQMQLPKRTSGEDCNGSEGDSNNDNGTESVSRAKSADLPRANPSPVQNTNGANGNGQRLPEFSHGHPPPPTANPPTYLHVYHNGLQGPPAQGPYGMSPHVMSPHGQFHPSLGYESSAGLMPPSNVYAMSVPTSIYNGGYHSPLMGGDLSGTLPPFGTVLPPYDQQFPHGGLTMTSNGPVYLHHGSVGPPPGSPPFDNESGIHSNSTSDGNDLKNGESPEAARSASAASGLELSDDADLMSVSSASTGFSSGSDESDLGSGVSSTVTSEGQGQVIKCPNCSKTFNRPCYLTQHQNSSHSGGKPFKCPTCGKRFLEAPALSDHVAKHGDNKPYKCDLCPKQFNHKTDLRRHLCLHSGQKPYVCTLCGKGFIRKDHMNKHCETHKKVKGQNQNLNTTQGQ